MGKRKLKKQGAPSRESVAPGTEQLLASYSERSQFFAREIGNYKNRLDRWLETLRGKTLDDNKWVNRSRWGIVEAAYNQIKQSRTVPHMVFVHPELVQQHPELLDYYCLLACLPQKGLNQLVRGIKRADLRMERQICILNQLLSAMVLDPFSYSDMTILSFIMAQAGTEIQGAWVNRIGVKAADEVWRIIVDYARQKSFLSKSRNKTTYTLINDVALRRGSEPDIEIQKGVELIAVIEIKGSLDPAGAQTRYGEAKKSFEKALKKNPRCETIYIANCLTDAVKSLIKSDGQVRKTFELMRLLNDRAYREDFLRELFHHICRVAALRKER